MTNRRPPYTPPRQDIPSPPPAPANLPDIDAIERDWLVQCGPCDYGLVEYGCQCPPGDPRAIIQRLCARVRQLEARPVAEAHQDAHREPSRDPDWIQTETIRDPGATAVIIAFVPLALAVIIALAILILT